VWAHRQVFKPVNGVARVNAAAHRSLKRMYLCFFNVFVLVSLGFLFESVSWSL